MESDEIIGYLLGYIKSTLNGAGALKGKNLVVTSIVDITGGKRINVQWTLDNGTVQTDHVDLPNGNGIKSVVKTSTSGLVDTYTITFDDDTTETFTVTNGADGEDGRDGADGQDGNGIEDIEKTSTAGLVDTYTITLDDGTTKTFTVTNGADGEGVPDGGTTGQILRKKSNTDQDTEWADPSEADLPAGGTTGQVLTKKSNDDGDVEWSTPAGAGDMLKSVYDTDDDGKVDAAEDADAVKGHTVASSGDAGNSDLVLGNDSRLTDSRTPTSHTHTKSEITDFSHTHTLSEITDAGTAAAKNSTNSITSGSTDLAEAGAVKDAIDAAVVSAYHPGGAKTCAELTSALLVAANEGKVYNMSDTGTTTADFIEGAGKEIGVGADVAVIPVSGGYKFNLLPGIVDTSGLQPKNLTSQVESQSTVEGALGALSTNKAAKVSGGTTGNLASLDASGNPADSGKKASDFIEKSQTSGLVKNDGTIDETQYISDISGKADKVASATNNNFAALDANGNLKDSGKKASDFVTDISGKADKVSSATNGDLAGLDANGNLTDTGIPAIIIPSGASSSNKLATKQDVDAVKGGAILPIVDLGTSYSAELKADIQAGTFEKAVVGGKLTINDHVYYLAHPDYWLHTGDTECTTHHMLVIPAGNIGTGKMNDTNITTGGYVGSDMKTGNNSNTALATAKAQIVADFGAANILTHRELFTKAVTDGKASDWGWYDSDVDLMNEVMVYGCNVWASAPGYETGIDKCQLKLFQERPDLITTRASWWLRSVVSATGFAAVSGSGLASDHGASDAIGVRPAFAIC